MKVFVVLLAILLFDGINCKNSLAVPSGFAHPSCVHEVADGSIVSHKNGGLIVNSPTGESFQVPRCHFPLSGSSRSSKPAHGPAWKTCAQYENTKSITYLYGEWPVPPNPTLESDQILYFWNGVEPEDNSEVVQPVLQWGSTPAGGGNYWAMASWYVASDGTALFSPLINTTIGDSVSGENSFDTNGTWVAVGTDLKSKQTTSLSYTPPETDYYYAYAVLESYSISTCNQYPPTGSVPFTNIQVQAGGAPVTPTWQDIVLDNPCKENTVIVSPTEVQINFSIS